MNDLEARFISALLDAPKQEQEHFFSLGIPSSVFSLRVREMFWITSFREKHGRYPSRSLFESQFKERYPVVEDSAKAVLELILNQARVTQLKTLVDKTRESLARKGADTAQVITDFQQGASSLVAYTAKAAPISVENSSRVLSWYEDFYRNKHKEGFFLIDTPWPAINDLIRYCSPGDLAVFSARSSLGKTWLTLFWAHYLASKKVSTLYVSKEMTNLALLMRFEALEYALPFDALRGNQLSPADLRRWRLARRKPKSPYLQILGNGQIGDIAELQTLVSKAKYSVVFVDGAYMFSPPSTTARNASGAERVAALSKAFKEFGQKNNCFVVVVLQQNREAEQEANKTKGALARIYGGDAWAQDCDFAFSLSGMRGSSRRMLNLDKGRDAAVGNLALKFLLSPRPDFAQIAAASEGAQIKMDELKD